MSYIEIFENLVEPLKGRLTEEQWRFLLSRGEMFISQMSPQVKNPIKQLHYRILNDSVNICRDSGDTIPQDIPEVMKMWAALDVIKPYIEEN